MYRSSVQTFGGHNGTMSERLNPKKSHEGIPTASHHLGDHQKGLESVGASKNHQRPDMKMSGLWWWKQFIY